VRGVAPNGATSPTTSAKLTAAERRVESLQLRKKGFSYFEIGEKLDVSGRTVRRDVQKYLEIIAQTCTETAEEVREIELQRLDGLWTVAHDKAIKGDLPAIDRCLRIQERRAKLLGLDAVQRVEHSGSVGVTIVDDIPRDTTDE
jgi:DNA-binding CsgD family transcriptional regulator